MTFEDFRRYSRLTARVIGGAVSEIVEGVGTSLGIAFFGVVWILTAIVLTMIGIVVLLARPISWLLEPPEPSAKL